MKKLAFLSSLVLLLSIFAGCSQQAAPTGSTEPSTAAPSTEPASTQPPELETPEFSVKTDYSQYVSAGSASKFSRLQADWIPDLVASEDYGKIYPFVGNLFYLIYEWGPDEYPSYRYGMIDENGRIVADATYDEITPVGIPGFNEYGEYFDGGSMPLWQLMRVEQGGDLSDSKKRYAFAALDGSFVTECKYSHIEGSRDGYVLAAEERSKGRIRFDLFDMEGNLVSRSEQLPVIEREGLKLLSACYSEDRFLLACRGKEEGSVIYYYTDEDGTKLMGPYDGASPFWDGYAVVMRYGNQGYAFIDKAGEITLDLAGYDFHYSYSGVYIAENEEGHKMAIDHRGKVIYSANVGPNDSIYYSYGLICHSADGKNTYYDMDGNLLYGEDVLTSWNYLGGGLFDTGKELINKNTGKSYKPEKYINSTNSGLLYGLDYVVCESRAHRSCIILNSSLELLAEHDKLNYSQFAKDPLSGKRYLIVETANANWLYGEDPTAPIRLPAGDDVWLTVYGDRVRCQSHDLCAYYSLTGELLFSYPLGISGSD